MSTVTSFDSSLASNLGRCVQPKYKVGSSRTTPGTNNSSRSLRSYTIVAIFEGREAQKGTIGLAVTDLRTLEMNLYEFIDSNSYFRLTTKIQVEDPIEIIVADTVHERKNTLLLIEALKNASEDATITTVHKRYFSDVKGAELVQKLANPEVSACDSVVQQKKRYAMAAFGGLVKYIEFIQIMMFSGKSLKVNYRDFEKICMIDMSSWKCLELIDVNEMSITKKLRRSLLSVIDYTLTPSGFRLLRSNLLQPLTDKLQLEERYNAVEEFLENSHLFDRIREILAHIHELDSILAVCALPTTEPDVAKCESNISQLQRLRKTLDVVLPLRKSLDKVNSEILVRIKDSLDDQRVEHIIAILDTTMNTSVLAQNKKNSLTLRNQKCYAIKAGMCVNLDVARKTYEELLTDLQDGSTTKELEDHLPNENARMAYSITRGFHYVWNCKNPMAAKLPSVFQNDVRNRSSISFTSKHLIRYNDRINQCVNEIMIASNSIVNGLIEQIRDVIPVLYNIMDSTATLDFLSSLAAYSESTETVRPILGNTLMFKEGRHPLIDHHQKDKCVPNDTYLTPEAHFGLITGPNMGGKSTYLRQICQLSILAQVGCMIPCEVAVVPLFNRIFSRVGHNDNLTKGLSAFSLEMSEMAMIMHYADSKSLIVIDELARSTSTEEGIGICYAIAEFLLQKKAFALLATHFLDLAALDEKYTVVENYHFTPQTRVDTNGNEAFNATHKLYKGPYRGPLYGFELIELSTFPTVVLKGARELAHYLKSENDKKAKITVAATRRKLLVRTALKLRQALVMKESSKKEIMIKYLLNIRGSYLRKSREINKLYEEEEEPEGEAVSEDAY